MVLLIRHRHVYLRSVSPPINYLMRLCRQHIFSALAGMCGHASMSRPTCQFRFRSRAEEMSTAPHSGADDGNCLSSAECVGIYEKFLTLPLRPGQRLDPSIRFPSASQARVIEDLASCLSAYTGQQHATILSHLAQARLLSYGQVNNAACLQDDRPLVHAYIHMLDQSFSRDMQQPLMCRPFSNLRLAAELMQPTATVCWPWPARARSSTETLPCKAEETAATVLQKVLKKHVTGWGNSSEMVLEWESFTDAMLALAIAGPYMQGRSGQRLIIRCAPCSPHS